MDIKAGELPLAKAFIKAHMERIINWSIGDIRRCCNLNTDGTCRDNGALVGAFILWCCAIDYFGGLYTGNPGENGTKTRVKEFITKYMSTYDWEKIYILRWSLIHFYHPNCFLLFHEGDTKSGRQKHLYIENKTVFLHLGCAIEDLEAAVVKYRGDLDSSDALKVRLWRYYKAQPPIMPIPFETILSPSAQLTTGQNLTASGTVAEDKWF